MIFILLIICLFWFVSNSINHAKIITQDPVIQRVLVTIIEIISILILFLFLKLSDSNIRKTLQLYKIKFKYLVPIMLISFGLILLAQGLRPILYNLLPGKDLLDLYESMWPTTTDHLIIFGIGGILIAPVFEELLFRGMILNYMLYPQK
jgi:membrane protease YdiL (CAAX protease family)